MSPELYEFTVIMAILCLGGAIFCLIGALVERWIK